MPTRHDRAPTETTDLPTGVASHPEGDLIGGRYRTVRQLGRGATSRVLLVHDRQTGRLCALKQLDERADAVRARLFEEEFRLLRSLAPHPHVVEPLEFGRDRERPFFTLEHLDGQDLVGAVQQLLAQGGKKRLGPRATGELVRLIGQLLSGLAHVHRRGLRHCDLKPSNVLVTSHGPKLLDLGLATPIGGEVAGGTLSYLAPEVLRGEPSDERADLFALGVALFRALTGLLPWDAEAETELEGGGLVRGAVTQRLLGRPAPSTRELNPRVPKAVDRLVSRLLAPRPEDRFPSAQRVLQELARARGVAAPSPGAVVGEAVGLLAPQFVGRVAVLEQLTDVAQQPGAAAITAPAGFGKTALLRELEAALQLAGRRTLRAAPPSRDDPHAPTRRSWPPPGTRSGQARTPATTGRPSGSATCGTGSPGGSSRRSRAWARAGPSC